MTTNYILQTTDFTTNATSTQFRKVDWDGTTTGVWTDTVAAQWAVAATINNKVYTLNVAKTSSRIINLASSSVTQVALPQAVDGILNDVSNAGIIAFYSATPTIPRRLNDSLGEVTSYAVTSGTFPGFTSVTGAMVLRQGTKLLTMSSTTLFSLETTTNAVTSTNVAAAVSQSQLSPIFAVNDDNVFAFSVSSATATLDFYKFNTSMTLTGTGTLFTPPSGNDTSSYAVTNAVANSSNVDVFNTAAFITGSTDAYFSSVVLLLHLDGANGSTTFTDVKGHPWVTQQSSASSGVLDTSVKKYGTAGLTFTSPADSVYGSTSPDYNFGSNDFTIDFWLNLSSSSPANSAIFGRGTNNFATYGFFQTGDAQKINFYASYADTAYDFVGNDMQLTFSTWQYILFSRVASSGYSFVDGVPQGSPQLMNGTFTSNTAGMRIGRSSTSSGGIFTIDDIRITNGVGRYTTTFTPPTRAAPDV